MIGKPGGGRSFHAPEAPAADAFAHDGPLIVGGPRGVPRSS
ncbi:hypothetical protein [Streptomyces sp. NPDC058157]